MGNALGFYPVYDHNQFYPLPTPAVCVCVPILTILFYSSTWIIHWFLNSWSMRSLSCQNASLKVNWLDKAWNVLRVSLFQHHKVVCDSFLMVYLSIISFLPWTERATRWHHWLPEWLCHNRLLSGGHLIQFWVATQKATYRHAAVGEVLRLQRVTGHHLKLHFTTVLAPFNGTNRLVSK